MPQNGLAQKAQITKHAQKHVCTNHKICTKTLTHKSKSMHKNTYAQINIQFNLYVQHFYQWSSASQKLVNTDSVVKLTVKLGIPKWSPFQIQTSPDLAWLPGIN